VLKRPVTIWDNLNANDYDQRHLCLGPFTGRSSDLSSRLSGMLINPNCEFELNFIPLNTLGQWFQSLAINEIDVNDDDDDDDENIPRSNVFDVEKAFEQSLVQWLPEFNLIK
jgi:protein O-GlcNAcase/histone acetyltransferase